MSRFKVSSSIDSGGGNDSNVNPSGGGIDNPAMQNDRMDPAELNVYGLYTKRNSVTCPPLNGSELKRKSSYGFTHLTR